ncbi:MAG: hypothetical protein HND45_04915 [Chloroflexi bacterium]|nr:hypothetical protein [Chloroflexota bacterium]NOG75222.1 hypothetical protein [Chloroflexota bacterium]GIK10543.1 MAG: hypothetical protein BroJett001_26090 [Chloroflexota bacterium]
MGKQVRFFMFENDESRFLEFLAKDKKLRFVLPVTVSTNFSIFEPRDILSLDEKILYLWDSSYDLHPYINSSFRKFYAEEVGRFIETDQMVYSISASNAPIIEYIRSSLNKNGELTVGRIWAEMYALNENKEFVYKGHSFEKLYDNLATWLRRNLKRGKEKKEYFGEGAIAWYQKGKPIKS